MSWTPWTVGVAIAVAVVAIILGAGHLVLRRRRHLARAHGIGGDFQ
jgi:hypothetical protein